MQSEGAKYVEGEAEVQDAALDNVGGDTVHFLTLKVEVQAEVGI